MNIRMITVEEMTDEQLSGQVSSADQHIESITGHIKGQQMMMSMAMDQKKKALDEIERRRSPIHLSSTEALKARLAHLAEQVEAVSRQQNEATARLTALHQAIRPIATEITKRSQS